MIKVEYSKLFLKDLKKIRSSNNYSQIKEFCFEKVENFNSIFEIPDIKKIAGYNYYYRKRIGNYRIGFKFTNKIITFMRVLDRSEIYKKFP